MAAATRAGFRRMFSVSAFAPPPPPAARPAAEPCNNLFVSARVVADRISGYSRGFGFVKYTTVREAGEGIKGMDGKFLDGWVIFVEYAKPREALPTSPPGYQ
ncbi:hypothetical protein PR202_ga29628 [Eleusine coracana subsp. coracana]|uniref:RRM domain-containing protein n=1 Tax=Eleusine coracana subsp. coracana TaxID=191504 RepID=A0AAV5DM31_ELECO|nr:hypothetical protein PR202_ga29628 [Eleusine coracana subsp. coracana]